MKYLIVINLLVSVLFPLLLNDVYFLILSLFFCGLVYRFKKEQRILWLVACGQAIAFMFIEPLVGFGAIIVANLIHYFNENEFTKYQDNSMSFIAKRMGGLLFIQLLFVMLITLSLGFSIQLNTMSIVTVLLLTVIACRWLLVMYYDHSGIELIKKGD